MNKSLDSSKEFDMDSGLLASLLPIRDCNDDIVMSTELNRSNQKVIKVDSERTRVTELKGLQALSSTKNEHLLDLDQIPFRTEKALTFYSLTR